MDTPPPFMLLIIRHLDHTPAQKSGSKTVPTTIDENWPESWQRMLVRHLVKNKLVDNVTSTPN